MAYLVIAVGLLMSLAGGYLLNYGYAIVQVERGWSSVIAGSVFLTGGLVTISLGVAFRAIVRALTGAGGAGRDLDDRSMGAAAPVESDARRATGGTVTDGAFVAEPTMTGPSLAGPSITGLGDPPFAPREPDMYALGAAGAPSHDPVASAPDSEGLDRGAPPRHDEAPHREEATDTALRDAHPASSSTQGSPRDAEPEAPAMDDWLDRAFSEIDGAPPPDARIAAARDGGAFAATDVPAPQHGMRLTQAEPSYAEATYAEPAYPGLTHAEADHAEPAYAETPHPEPIHEEPAHREPAYAEAPPPQAPASPVPASAVAETVAPTPSLAPHDSPVIGRYESDDTSYVMYADGSIEAQSPAGVYRFSSMAELKAFIEG